MNVSSFIYPTPYLTILSTIYCEPCSLCNCCCISFILARICILASFNSENCFLSNSLWALAASISTFVRLLWADFFIKNAAKPLTSIIRQKRELELQAKPWKYKDERLTRNMFWRSKNLSHLFVQMDLEVTINSYFLISFQDPGVNKCFERCTNDWVYHVDQVAPRQSKYFPLNWQVGKDLWVVIEKGQEVVNG